MHTGNTQGDSYFRLNINIENNPLCSCDNGRAGFPYAVSYAVPGCPHKHQSTGWSSLRRNMGICFARSHPVDWCVLSSFVPRSRSERSHVRLAASKCPDCQVFRPRSGSGRADVRFATDSDLRPTTDSDLRFAADLHPTLYRIIIVRLLQ